MVIIYKFLLYILLLTCITLQANAAQDSTIISDNAPIRMEPNDYSKVIEYLAIGAEVRLSSFPLQGGWYKIRSSSGVYGWIHENFLSVYKPDLESDKKEDRYPQPERDRKWTLRAFGGVSFFTPKDLNNIFGFTKLNTGYHVGAEAGVFVSRVVGLVLRFESIFKDLVARETQSNLLFNLAIRSYTLMGGFDIYIAQLPALRLSMGVLAGFAPTTLFSSEAITLTPPNLAVIKHTPFSALGRINFTRPLGRLFSVFLEAGYRYLKTALISTSHTTEINGGRQIFAKDGTFQARTINLSGPEISGGLGIHF